MSVIVPASVSRGVPTPVAVTPPLVLALNVPVTALSCRMIGSASASTSVRVKLVKSTLLGTFWVMVRLAGRPLAVGSSFTAVTFTVDVTPGLLWTTPPLAAVSVTIQVTVRLVDVTVGVSEVLRKVTDRSAV